MFFSIITAVKNGEAFIADSCLSLQSQSFKDYEHIVIDALSTDNTVSIIKNNHDSKIISESDNGIYEALNKGIVASSGEIIGFLNADDLYFNDEVLSEVYKEFNNTNADIVYGDLVYVDKTAKYILRDWKSNKFKHSMLVFGWMPPHPALFIRKDIYMDLDYFDSSYDISGDYEFILRLFSCGKYKASYIPITLVKMRVGGVSNKSFYNILKKMREDYFALKKNKVGGLFSLILKNLRKVPQLPYFNKYTD